MCGCSFHDIFVFVDHLYIDRWPSVTERFFVLRFSALKTFALTNKRSVARREHVTTCLNSITVLNTIGTMEIDRNNNFQILTPHRNIYSETIKHRRERKSFYPQPLKVFCEPFQVYTPITIQCSTMFSMVFNDTVCYPNGCIYSISWL